MDDELKDRIDRLASEKVEIVKYSRKWPKQFKKEKKHLESVLPDYIVKRIEHFGSTAVPGLAAKPIIDILVEVTSLDLAKDIIVPMMEEMDYEYFWRPLFDKDEPPYYAWFIKRNQNGHRSHHIHMVEADSVLWDRLYFRDYLREFPDVAKEYSRLKSELVEALGKDRVAYTKAKTDFIVETTKKAKNRYS